MEDAMTITFSDGRKKNAVILAQDAGHMRLALEGSDDVLAVAQYNGRWISEDCEPVRMGYEWEMRGPAEIPAEADCICSKDLAARMIQLLLRGSDDEAEPSVPLHPARSARAIHVV